MSTFELAVWVVGVVALVRKAWPSLDGWAVVVLALVASGTVAAAVLGVDGVPMVIMFVVLARAGGIAGIAAGLVALADRIAARAAPIPFRPSMPAPVPLPPPTVIAEDTPVLHRSTLLAALAFSLLRAAAE